MEKVIVSHFVKCDEQPSSAGAGGRVPTRHELKEKGEAIFHQFGISYEEFESGPGNYSTAIVEWPDGTIESVLAERIRFINPHQI